MSAVEVGPDALRGNFPCSPASLHGRFATSTNGAKIVKSGHCLSDRVATITAKVELTPA